MQDGPIVTGRPVLIFMNGGGWLLCVARYGSKGWAWVGIMRVQAPLGRWLQIPRNQLELLQRRLQVFHNFLGNH